MSHRAFEPIAIMVLATLLPMILGQYGIFLISTVVVYYLVGLSFNILTGIGGQVSIGHAGFWGLGAYGSAVLVTHAGAGFLTSIVFAVIVAATAGFLVALPALRVSGNYLAIATLAFVVLTQQLLLEAEPLTGGRQGLPVVRSDVFGMNMGNEYTYYYFLLIVAFCVTILYRNLARSFLGREMLLQKDNDIVARSYGVSTARSIFIAFILSAGLTGLSGALYAYLIEFLSTETFSFEMSIAFLAMAVVGGMGSYRGALLGALYLAMAPELFRNLRDAQLVLYGASIIICVKFLPRGLASIPEIVQSRLSNRSDKLNATSLES